MKQIDEQKKAKEEFKKDNPLSFSKYKKLVEEIKYKDFSISLSDVAKYPDEFSLEYKYQISCPNWEGSGINANTIIFPAMPPFEVRDFTGFAFDNRVQLSRIRLYTWLKEVADKVRYNNPKYSKKT